MGDVTLVKRWLKLNNRLENNFGRNDLISSNYKSIQFIHFHEIYKTVFSETYVSSSSHRNNVELCAVWPGNFYFFKLDIFRPCFV